MLFPGSDAHGKHFREVTMPGAPSSEVMERPFHTFPHAPCLASLCFARDLPESEIVKIRRIAATILRSFPHEMSRYNDLLHVLEPTGNFQPIGEGSTGLTFEAGSCIMETGSVPMVMKLVCFYDGIKNYRNGSLLLEIRGVGERLDGILDSAAETCRCLRELGVSNVPYHAQFSEEFVLPESGKVHRVYYQLAQDLRFNGRCKIIELADAEKTPLRNLSVLLEEAHAHAERLWSIAQDRGGKYSVKIMGHRVTQEEEDNPLLAFTRMFYVLHDTVTDQGILVPGDLNHVLINEQAVVEELIENL